MDPISYGVAAKQKQRIEKVIAEPDSTSGVITVPQVIAAGETITVPAGRVAVLPNVQVDGTLNVEGEVFVPTGSTVDMGNGLTINGEKIVMSVPTSYHLLQGNLAVDNTIITQGFNTTLYTGNGSTQSINTGIDMDTQWGDTAEEKFGGLVWQKYRSTVGDNTLIDSIRGAGKFISSNTTSIQGTDNNSLSSFTSNGFNVGTSWSGNGATAASWNFQTTHRVSGVTNHGKPYTCHYNPFTGFTIVKYEGSGLTGHEIPHYLGRKLEFEMIKCLGTTVDWEAYTQGKYLIPNLTNAGVSYAHTITDSVSIQGINSSTNVSNQQHILYGWANSYFDEKNTLIGNYEIGVYQGTGASGNKITTRGKPAWVMIKRLDSTGHWSIQDNLRNSFDNLLFANLSQAEILASPDQLNILSDEFMLTGSDAGYNASGGQYLYMVAYDTNSDGGGSYYPKTSDTAHVQINNALIPIAKGSDINGLKNVMLSKNETITGLTYTAGKNYVYCDANGSYGVKSVAPNYGTTNQANGGDFYNTLENKWYTSAGVEIPEGRNYLNHIVHADNDGGVLYVEELPKVEYKDVIKANEYQGKNACTAWVNFTGTTTPVTILDSYNIKAVVRTATGNYEVYFENEMDNTGYSANITTTATVSWTGNSNGINPKYVNKFKAEHWENGALANIGSGYIQIFGGKN